MTYPIIGVAAVIWNGRGEFLLIRRTRPPRLGEWSLPGGKVEFGESLLQAVMREAKEETALDTEVVGLIGVVETIRDAAAGAPDSHFVLIDYTLRAKGGVAAAGSDAAEATWFAYRDLDSIPMWEDMRGIIRQSAERHMGLQPP